LFKCVKNKGFCHFYSHKLFVLTNRRTAGQVKGKSEKKNAYKTVVEKSESKKRFWTLGGLHQNVILNSSKTNAR
jgi:hypothetical protein